MRAARRLQDCEDMLVFQHGRSNADVGDLGPQLHEIAAGRRTCRDGTHGAGVATLAAMQQVEAAQMRAKFTPVWCVR